MLVANVCDNFPIAFATADGRTKPFDFTVKTSGAVVEVDRTESHFNR